MKIFITSGSAQKEKNASVEEKSLFLELTLF